MMKSPIWTVLKAVLSRLWELKASTEIDTSAARQKNITNQALDEHRRTPLCTRCVWNTGANCRTRFEIIWTKELAEAETASHAADSILSSPRTTGQTVATEEVSTGQSVERGGGASCQLDENQLQSMTVSRTPILEWIKSSKTLKLHDAKVMVRWLPGTDTSPHLKLARQRCASTSGAALRERQRNKMFNNAD